MDSELVKKLKPRILDPFAGKEGEMVRSADLLAAIVECLMEIETGNNQPAFRSALNSMLDQLAKSEFSSVRFVSEDFKWGLRWMGR
jgi:putative hydrolase of HD superfamily